MLIRLQDRCEPRSFEITPEKVYLSRRRLMQTAGAAALLPLALAQGEAHAEAQGRILAPLKYRRAGPETAATGFYTAEPLTPYQDVTHYNNFYEFGTSKASPARHAGALRVKPWSVRIAGETEKPGEYALEDLLAPHSLEERIYRLRCVEAWSMVIPWVGIPLGDLLKRYPPTSKARYVAFTTLHDPKQMRGQRRWSFGSLKWPYVEGLRLDEAMHPLAFLAVGLYGKELPGQNGAPLRLVVPWKYGFKSIKSIVEIRYTQKQPPASWNLTAPKEYGFYSNVNPKVDHPRWSQAIERRLPGSLFGSNRIPTRMFNGYGEQVAQLYAGMDLRRHY